ncbi:hypothetical protein CKO42_12085 [Lamprobacter modestohalophilus]|uniref:Uncharacterized protein n=2 Tax=Lamprobacter modestohalophilus TaxID=1064514 RepID=A0A9X0W988_9GAMM|nr:hypothetical protein [Lamprobacter modestohalophilus]MCF7979189.1 hypothetical protein [Chromatiaceae bacterium]MCF7996668.1 hypothetical protein [Chromatiaceae bacterium]MCF8016694.1 hypothetical protein [Chromatiaceae bacterium]
MRAAVLLSALLLAAGVLLGVIAMMTPLTVPTSQLALVLVLSAALLLAVIFLVALIPGVSRHMDECRH